jgi:hypothetical protein
MDLLMITLSPFKMPMPETQAAGFSSSATGINSTFSKESIDNFKAQKHILGLIVSNSNGTAGPRSSQVLVSKKHWETLKSHFQDIHVSTFKSTSKGNGNGARLSNHMVGKM